MKLARPLSIASALLLFAPSACTKPPEAAGVGEKSTAEPEAEAEAEAEPEPEPEAKREAAPAKAELPLADIPIPDPPTPEELELLKRDPETLSPEERKARAHARYKQVMQNPDSPEAKVIRQARAQIEGSQAQGGIPGAVGAHGPTFHQKTSSTEKQ